ncbi:MAG: hypothetical protein V1766_11375 [Pseudomonadota bacterium]
MRIEGLDHLRGIGVLLVLFFSVAPWVYVQGGYEFLNHVIKGEFHLGDLVFPLFLFSSGTSIFLYLALHGKVGFFDGAKKYAKLLFVALFISALRLFLPFPDEVMVIAVCDTLIFAVLMVSGKRGLAAYCIAGMALLATMPNFAAGLWEELTKPYLGGTIGIIYYSLYAAGGFFAASAALQNYPKKIDPSAPEAYAKFGIAALIVFLVSLMFWEIDRTGLSITFVFLSLAVYCFALAFLVWLCDNKKIHNGLISTLGSVSIVGWAVFYATTSAVLLSGESWAFSWSNYLLVLAAMVSVCYVSIKALIALHIARGRYNKH